MTSISRISKNTCREVAARYSGFSLVCPGRPKLPPKVSALISDGSNVVYISPVSYWEIAIKISLGKYTLNLPFRDFMERQIAINRFEVLHVLVSHTAVLTTLPWHHRDAFDCLLVAQAIAEQMPIVGG